jgi:hypothetical protein
MRTWIVAVHKGPLPEFPYETPDVLPVTCVRIHRVDMKGLSALVNAAATETVETYNAALKLDNRATFSYDGRTHIVY